MRRGWPALARDGRPSQATTGLQAEREFPAHKFGRLWKLKQSEVDQWVCGFSVKVEDEAS